MDLASLYGPTSDSVAGSPDSISPVEFPSYLPAADNHNLGNVGSSWFDYNPINLPKFAAVSVLSGLNSIYNTGMSVGNFLGGDATFKESDTGSLISGIDSDLGAYYQENKPAADLMGFLVTSLIPGTTGIKILNAGQKAIAAAKAGYVGTNLGLALGLRTPLIESYIASSATEIATGQAAFSSITSSAAKALSLGVYQNVLEGAAFETAVQATMQASPILDGQSKSDVVWNIATGGLFGGVLGGAIQSARTLGAIRAGVKQTSAELLPFSSRATWHNTSVTSDRLINFADDLEHGPVLDPGDPLYQTKVGLLEQRQIRIRQDIRSTIHEMTPGSDTSLSRGIADFTEGQPSQDIINNFLDVDQVGRLQTPTRVEKNIKETINAGASSGPESHQVAYWKLSGEEAGSVLNRTPEVHNLADSVVETSGNSTRSQIMGDVRAQKYRVGDNWSAADSTLDSSGHLDAERRYIWANDVLNEVKEGSSVGLYDIPVLERALKDQQLSINLTDPAGKVIKAGFGSTSELQQYIIAAKEQAAATLQERALLGRGTNVLTKNNSSNAAQDWVTEKIGKIVNTKVARLNGDVAGDADYFAWQDLQRQRDDFLRSKGIKAVDGEENDPRFLPSWAKVTKIVRDKEVDGNVVDGLTYIKSMQAQAQGVVDQVVAKQMGSMASALPRWSDSYLAKTNAIGTGSRPLAINNPEYDSPGSLTSLIGSLLSKFARDSKDTFSGIHSGLLSDVARNQDAVIEWASLNQRVSRSAQTWVKHTEFNGKVSEHYLVDAKEYGQVFGDGADATGSLYDISENGLIPIKNESVGNLVDAHSNQTREINGRRNERSSAAGTDQARQIEIAGAPIFRPIPPDPKDYPFIAFIKDHTVTSQGHTSMIFAQNENQLRDLVASAQRSRPELSVFYKSDTVDFFKARQAYEADRALSDNYIDSSLKNNGLYSNYFATTDPQKMANDYLQHHLRLIDTDAREIIRAKYQPQFDWLEDQATNYSRVETSKFGGNFDQLEAQGKNPYLSYVKTALNLSRVQEVPLWNNVNKLADQTVSTLYGKIQDLWGATSTPSAESLESINKSLAAYGMNTGYYDAATQLTVNHVAPKAVLSQFVRGANAILAKFTLGLDPLNALVNALGANILRTTELSQQLDAAAAGNSDIAGKLAQLYKLDVTGKGDLIRSPVKLMAQAGRDFFSSDPTLLPTHQLYRDLNLQRGYGDQFRSIVRDDLALRGTETADILQTKLRSALTRAVELSGVAEKYTGNKLAEEFNRFVSARSAELVTNPAVDAGIMTRQEQYAYMNTFVNRVEGNIIASQRPFAFQGPIGQAIGLFQSYQFNIMQQMFRYVAEGSGKDAAMLLGLQGTFFGLQGMPAFQAINQHIIGTASGNPKHIDAYDATYGIVGKNLGDLLTYGLPSNLLSTNLYARGDINPRQLTVIPTALNEVPIVGAFTKFFGDLKDTTTKIGTGANVWETLLQGIEHNGISRPLSGIAQTLQATTGSGVPFSTTSKGSIMFSNDLLSLATLSRLSGGRPLDEAIINDGIFRIHSYQQDDLAKMDMLSRSIKASGINGQTVSSEQTNKFLGEYIANGGKQVMFNKFMMNEITQANTSEAQKITKSLNNPFAQKVQLLMGTNPQFQY